MRKYERIQRLKSLLKTLLGCTGWGILGALLMSLEGLFWPGYIIFMVAGLVAACAADRYVMPVRRW